MLTILVLLTACGQSPAAPSATPSPTPVPTRAIPPTSTPLPTATPTLVPTQRPSATPTPIPVCSPLADITLAELPEILTNPFQQPTPGWDDGHQGVDLAFYRRGDRIGIEGLPVKAVLAGRVAAVVNGTWPYGNMLMIESNTSQIPTAWLPNLQMDNPPVIVTPDSRLYCPPSSPAALISTTGHSLYILYAHLQNPSGFQVGDTLACGEEIGQVGNTGYSGNPHLHLEFRVGPSNATFQGISHYVNTATTEEMVNYCLWRVSGLFRMLDPMPLLTSQP